MRSPTTCVLVTAVLLTLVVGCSGSDGRAVPTTAASAPVRAVPSGPSPSTSAAAPPAAPAVTSAAPPATTAVSGPPVQRMEPALPTAVQETAAAATSDRLFVVGGYDAKGTSTATVFVFDGTAWTTGAALPIAVNHPGAASVNGTVYEAGGFAGSGATARAFALDAGAPAWREIAPMHHARGALALLAVAGKLYAIGGRSGSTQIAPTEVYDPSADRWTDVADLPRARNHVAGYVDGARACVAGGREPDTSSAINCFDTATGTWAPGPALKQPTSGALAALVGGTLIVAGGEPSGETSLVTVVQEWRNGWTTEPMLVPRHGTGYAAFQGRVWACGGATAPGVHATAACTSFAAP